MAQPNIPSKIVLPGMWSDWMPEMQSASVRDGGLLSRSDPGLKAGATLSRDSAASADFSRAAWAAEYPFTSRHLDLDGVRYHYLDEGRGAPLLFVHGNPTWSFAWRRFVREFSRDHRAIAVDHVGCGLSDKPQDYAYTLAQHVANLRRLIETLDLRDVTLVAHDWGGAIGLGAAVAAPERFTRLVLCNTAAFRSTRIPWRIAACRIPLLGPLGVRGFNLFARAALVMATEKRANWTPAMRAGYLAPYDSWAHRIAVQRFVEDIPLRPGHPSYQTLLDIEKGLKRLADKPVLLAWGERDWCFTPHFRERFQREFFPHAEVFPIADAGHYVFEDAPEALLARIREFMGGGARG